VYPVIPASYITYEYSTTPNSDTYWSLAGFLHSQIPALAERGLSGYYNIEPNDVSEADINKRGKLSGRWIALDLSKDAATALLAPVESYANETSLPDDISIKSNITTTTSFMEFWLRTKVADSAGYNVRMGSRLLTNTSLLGSQEKLINALRTATTSPTESNSPLILIGSIVGPAPNARHLIGGIAGGSNAVLPAWRETYSHLMVPRTWTIGDTAEKLAITTDLREVRVPALRDIEPESGAYMSESDPTEVDWQRTKYGVNYAGLLKIKQHYDPRGVFWCTQCVGSELWDTIGDFGVENGVNQNIVRLCRK
jgi:FAD/FMN-containing dehydrogenase